MGSVNKQTDAYLRAIKPGNPQKIGFGGRLYMHVSPTGSPATGGMSWRMNYLFDGKDKTLSLGKYPAIGIRDARQRRDEAKEQLAKGIDPSAEKKLAKVERYTFEAAGERWYEHHAAETVPTTHKKSRMYLDCCAACKNDPPERVMCT